MIGTRVEIAVRFVPGHDADCAKEQEALIKSMGDDGWEWTGFSSAQRGVEVPLSNGVPGVATETAGFIIYFRRPTIGAMAAATVGPKIREAVREQVTKGATPPVDNRATRRRFERERGGRAN
jgi:hypothetical protein